MKPQDGTAYINGEHWILPDGRTIPRLAGGQETDEEKAAREQREAEEREKEQREQQKPPWGSDEEFDPKRAWKLIEDLRAENKQVKADREEVRGKVKEFEDREKTQAQKDAEARDAASQEAAEAKAEATRLRVAMKHGLDEEDLDLLGSGDEEQIEARAKRLAERSIHGKDEERQERPGRPRERLRPGAAPGAGSRRG